MDDVLNYIIHKMEEDNVYYIFANYSQCLPSLLDPFLNTLSIRDKKIFQNDPARLFDKTLKRRELVRLARRIYKDNPQQIIRDMESTQSWMSASFLIEDTPLISRIGNYVNRLWRSYPPINVYNK